MAANAGSSVREVESTISDRNTGLGREANDLNFVGLAFALCSDGMPRPTNQNVRGQTVHPMQIVKT
jgi:hypothetical protein